MKRCAFLFVQALIGYLVVGTVLLTYSTAQTSPAVSSGGSSSEVTQETSSLTQESDRQPASSPHVPRVHYGIASWYGRYFHGRPTASGERYDMMQVTAAHRSLPLGTQAVVTNLENGQAVQVRINDRGPYIPGRMLDLSYGAAQRIGMVQAGLARVKVELLPGGPDGTKELQNDQNESGARAIPATLFEPSGAVFERRSTGALAKPVAGSGMLGWFAVQASAFRDLSAAVSMQRVLMAFLPTVWISSVEDGHQTLHRIRIGPFTNRDDAERAARLMAQQGFGMGHVILQ